jgi:hypothetical protein
MKNTVIAAIAIILSYIITACVTYQFNPVNWGTPIQIAACVLVVLLFLVAKYTDEA